uniref:Uncharacterized protein n=1 Tax=uncultured marine virus TaxID=186617 RepID=A0A0F7L8Z7_9VIRU|nr:hypothetical protein [uncultured marine virus]
MNYLERKTCFLNSMRNRGKTIKTSFLISSRNMSFITNGLTPAPLRKRAA